MRPKRIKDNTCQGPNPPHGGELFKTQITGQSGKTSFLSSYQMLLRMKKSWMKMQPKGRMPPMTIPGLGFVKKDCSGIWRGIWFVRTGCSIACTGTHRVWKLLHTFKQTQISSVNQEVEATQLDRLGGLTHSFLESKVGTNEGQGHRDSKPQSQNGHQSAKGDCCWGTLHPKDQVHQEEVCKHNAREERWTTDNT